MKRSMSLLLATVFAAGFAVAAANAKTLVYCSEGSPEGFDPGALHERAPRWMPPRRPSTTASSSS